MQAATVVIKPCLKHSQSAGVLDLCRHNKPSLAGRTREAEEVLQVLKGDGPPQVRPGASGIHTSLAAPSANPCQPVQGLENGDAAHQWLPPRPHVIALSCLDCPAEAEQILHAKHLNIHIVRWAGVQQTLLSVAQPGSTAAAWRPPAAWQPPACSPVCPVWLGCCLSAEGQHPTLRFYMLWPVPLQGANRRLCTDCGSRGGQAGDAACSCTCPGALPR